MIVTNNLKDFPETYLESFGMKVKSADDFLTDIIDLNPNIALQAFKALVMNRTNPEMNEFEVLEILRNRGLLNTAVKYSLTTTKTINFKKDKDPEGVEFYY